MVLMFWRLISQAFGVALAMVVAAPAWAHVAYVLEPAVAAAGHAPWALDFFLTPFTRPLDILYLVLVPVAGVLVYLIFRRSDFLQKQLRRWREHLDSYHDLIPWMLRLSVGIALIGYGTSGHLLTPTISNADWATFQVALGFLLLMGLLTRLAALGVISLYLLILSQAASLLGGLEILGAAVVLFITGAGRPSLDDILGLTMTKYVRRLSRALHQSRHLIPFLLRLTLGATFVWLGLTEKFLNSWWSAAVVEKFNLTQALPVSVNLWVLGAGGIEIILGLLLILGLWVRPVGVVAFAVLILTFFFFGESVVPHVTLFGVLSVLIVSGGSSWSVDQIRIKTVRHKT